MKSLEKKIQRSMMRMENEQLKRLGCAFSTVLLLALLTSTMKFGETLETCENITSVESGDCEEGVLVDDNCTDYTMTFETVNIEIEQDECVRLHFRKLNEQHFIADSLSIPELNLSFAFDLTKPSSVKFSALTPGKYAYISSGMCQINIPDADTVVVDCAVFCGKTTNTEEGFITVNPKKEGN